MLWPRPAPGGGADEAAQTFTYTVSNDNAGLFFLSCNDLADRVASTPPKAHRNLNGLRGHDILELVEKGTRFEKGRTGPRKATEWRYLLNLPDTVK